MNDLDRLNLAELTKGGQPATAVSPRENYAVPWGTATVQHGARIVERPDTDVIQERGDVAHGIALDLGYGHDNAILFRNAAEQAARVGLSPSGVLREAGQVSLGTVKTHGGTVVVMSILLDSGAYYDPTKVQSIGNNSVGND